jgi:hypothetical protein
MSKVNIDLVSMNTKQVENSTKTLKQRIKELKDELANLNLESDEAKAKLQELGALLHTSAEITELARLKSIDYGDTLASVTQATAGLVGGISAVNSVMTLMGVNSSETAKSLQTMTALMALVQSLSTLDTAEKSWRALYEKVIKAVGAKKLDAQATADDTKEQNQNTTAVNQNTTAVNQNTTAVNQNANSLKSGVTSANLFKNGVRGLWSALKGFAVANPFTLIIMSLTSGIALLSKFNEKAKEARLEAEKAKTKALEDLYRNPQDTNDIMVNSAWDAEMLARRKKGVAYYKMLSQDIMDGVESGISRKNELKLAQELFEELRITEEKYTKLKNEVDLQEHFWSFKNKEQQESKEGVEEYKKLLNNYLSLYNAQYEFTKNKLVKLSHEITLLEKDSDEYNEKMNKINATIVELDESYNEALNKTKELDAINNKEKEDEKKAEEDKKKAREDFYAKQLNDLKTSLTNQQLELELSYKKREISEKEYLDKSLELNKWYYAELEKIKYNPNLTKTDILQAQSNITSSENNISNFNISKIREKQIKEANILTTDETKRLLNDIETYKQLIIDNNAKILVLQGKSLREQYELLKQVDNQSKEEKLRHINDMLSIDIDYYDNELKLIRQNYEEEKRYATEQYQREKEALEEELKTIKNEADKKIQEEKINQLKEEYNKSIDVLKQQYLLNEYDIELQKTTLLAEASNERFLIEKEEIEKRIELQEKYYEAYMNIYSGLSGFIREIQSGYDSNSKEYKNIQKTMIIADTISASMSAYKSGVSSGLPAPTNLIYGGVLAAIATAQGITQLKNLENETINTTSAVNNVSNTNPYETLSYATLSQINGNIVDSKVYVVESELQAVSKSVDIYETEAQF